LESESEQCSSEADVLDYLLGEIEEIKRNQEKLLKKLQILIDAKEEEEVPAQFRP